VTASFFSIITINYNNCSKLIKTAESVLRQQYKNFEYLIIDGGSTDQSTDYINTIKDKLAFTVSEPDKGIYHAMNKGWQKAGGDYCLFLNSGDFFFNDLVLSKVANYITNNEQADIYYGNIMAFDKEVRFESKFTEPLSLYYFYHKFLPHPATFFSRKILSNLNGFNENYSIIADWIFFVEAFLQKTRFQYIDEIISEFEMNGLSSNNILAGIEKERVFNNELSILKDDFNNFSRLRHYDTSRLIKAAAYFSRIKMRFGK
jgi:glycosyltransferase involved in cell wall biosynthesis